MTSSTPGTSSNPLRTSKEKVPIPHARGGNVEKIAVRTIVRPFRQKPEACANERKLDRLAASLAASRLQPRSPPIDPKGDQLHEVLVQRGWLFPQDIARAL